jgi:hypothetical protein
MKTPNRSTQKKAVDKRRKELKSIQTQLKKISEDERHRVKELWKLHKDFFVDEETMDVVVMPEQTIDDFFEN